MAYLLSETFKFPKDNFESMKYQPYELKPNFSMYRIYEWHRYWDEASGGKTNTIIQDVMYMMDQPLRASQSVFGQNKIFCATK